MAAIQKLKLNLAESDRWRCTFREEIKKSLNDISTKNEEIILMAKTNAAKRDELQKQRCELKLFSDGAQKVEYKTAKMRIKVEQLEARIKTYHQSLAKKEEYNRGLTAKILALEVDVEREKSMLFQETGGESTDGNLSDDGRSVSSRISEVISFKSNPYKTNVRPLMEIDQKLNRINKIERQHIGQVEKNKRREEDLERASKIGQKLKEKLYNSQQEIKVIIDFLTPPVNALASVESTTTQLQRIDQSLNQSIQFQHQFIQKFFSSINSLLLCDNISDDIRKQTVLLEREAKRQKSTMAIMSGYMMNEPYL